jgi:type III secretory pathway component EscS
MIRRPRSRGRLLLIEIRNVIVMMLLGVVLIAAIVGAVIGLVALATR